MTLLMIIAYAVYLIFLNDKYRFISFIQIIFLFSNFFDVNWFFFGMENFKLTVTRNIIIKIISLICIFLFVKSKDDLALYVFILGASNLTSNLLLIPFLLKNIQVVHISFNDIKKNIKPIIILFIPIVAVSLYKIMDKIMLGILGNVNEVGIYEQSEKIINMPLSLITALGTVMLPRISNLIANGYYKSKVISYTQKSMKFSMFLSFPICFGLIAVSHIFIPIFLGNDFYKSIYVVYMLSPTIIFISFANVIRTQYLIPYEKDNIFIFSVVGGAILNIIMNIILIPYLYSIGACIGTIMAEFFVVAFQTYFTKKELPIKDYFSYAFEYFYKSIIMFLFAISVNLLPINNYVKFVLSIVCGVIVYIILNFNYIKNMVKGKVII